MTAFSVMRGARRVFRRSSVAGRIVGAAIVSFAMVGCTSGVPARTPECNAAINRCMQSCGDQPEVLSPRSQAIPGPEGTNVRMNNCEATCQSKC